MEGNDQPDEDHDDFPVDDASIEILSQSGDSHARDSEWSIYSPSRSSRSSIAGSEMSLMDFQKVSIHSKMATIVHQDGRQFIERRDLDDGGLPYSAEFYLNGEVWKLSGEDCVLMSSRRYIAEVNMEGTIDLRGAVGFEKAVRTLLKHLKVEKVLLDKELEECNKIKSVLKMTLDKLTDESEENIECKRDVMLLRMLLKKHGNSLNMDFKHDLRNCSRLSSEIMSVLDNYVTKVLKLIQRNEFLGHLIDSSLSDEFINAAIQEALNQHRARLEAICPLSMKNKLKEFPDDRILYVTKEDMHLFTDLTTLDEAIFKAVLPMIFSKFLTRVEEISDEQFTDLDPLSNRIFLYVCKSMQEVAEELSAHNIISYCSYCNSEALEWKVYHLQEKSLTSYSKCLRQPLQMLAKLANHFEPGGPFRTSRFPYEFKVFQYMDAIPEPVRIWLCLLDDCMKDLVQADLDKMQMLSCFFKSYVSFIASEDFRSETLECLRTITHQTLRSLAGMASSQLARTILDLTSLDYNKMINCCLDKFPREHFGNECDQIVIMLREILSNAFFMAVSSDELSKLFNEFKQLLIYLRDLQFEWVIRLSPSDKRKFLLLKHFIVPVDNIRRVTEDECFKVVDLEGFVLAYKLLYNSEEMPKPYQLKVLQVLLPKMEKLAKQSGNDLSDKDLLDAVSAVIKSIKNSLDDLKEQPGYCQFEECLPKMSEPCNQAIKEEVQELPHIVAIDSEETLDQLLDRFEASIPKAFLKNGLTIYTTQFNKHIAETAQLSREKRIEKIVSDVMSKIKPKLASSWTKEFKKMVSKVKKVNVKIEPKIVTSWTEEFKRNELPEVLAGLSAVWSVIVSENNSSSEKMTKPSLLQICCVLSVFGDEENYNKDYSNQYLQLSTQEGKGFVLGLTAALLGLYGHKVEIVCFNNHLTRANSHDWMELSRSFSIHNNIEYESLHDMARERSLGIYDKYVAYVYECMGLETYDYVPKNASEDERSVLLIEDIHIFLQEDTLSMPYRRSVSTFIPGLEGVQQMRFSQNNSIPFCLRALLSRPHSYTLLEGNPFKEVEYTNKTLYLKHWEAMNSTDITEDYFAGDYKYGYLSLGDIPFPYEHLLKSFPFVLGFASAPLDVVDEVPILTQHYGMNHSICVSDISQTIPTKFDPKKDFHYIDSEDDCVWMNCVTIAMKAAIDRNCLVLVILKSVRTWHLKELIETFIESASNWENLTKQFFYGDEICVQMVYNGKFSKDRQVHVIQTFFSEDGKEENLIRRQAERSHSSGSYELIIPSIRYSSRYNLAYKNRKEDITYEWFVRQRGHITSEELKLGWASNSEQYMKIKNFLKL